jgi:hypothetical protein
MHKYADAGRTITLYTLLVCHVLLASLLISPKEFAHQFLRERSTEIRIGFNTALVCASRRNHDFLQSFDARDGITKVDFYETPAVHDRHWYEFLGRI